MSKHFNKEFRKGFGKGYMSPFDLFLQPTHRYTKPTKNIVTIAWARVGRTLEESTQREVSKIGK